MGKGLGFHQSRGISARMKTREEVISEERDKLRSQNAEKSSSILDLTPIIA